MGKFRQISRKLFLLILCLSGFAAFANESLPRVEITEITDFSQLTKQAEEGQKLILLEFSASYCSFCVKLEEEIIKPMLRSGDYDADVLIRKLQIDSYSQFRDIDGNLVSGDDIARRWQVKVTPTIIFLNSQNQEVSERIVGVNSLDYFGGFVDDAIDQGLAAIR